MGSQVRSRFYACADTFLFDSKSQSNDLCLQVATEVKKIRPNVKLIYVRAEYPHINEDYKKYLLNFYDDTYSPDKILNAGRAAYIERNFHMINRADICIFYFDKAYSPPREQPSNNHVGYPNKKVSGTKLAYDYALLKKKAIINICSDT